MIVVTVHERERHVFISQCTEKRSERFVDISTVDLIYDEPLVFRITLGILKSAEEDPRLELEFLLSRRLIAADGIERRPVRRSGD